MRAPEPNKPGPTMKTNAIKNPIRGTILILALFTNGIAQTSASSTQANPSPTASPNVVQQAQDLKRDTGALRLEVAERQIARLIGELRAGRNLSAEQSAEITALQDRLQAELANSVSLDKSYASAVREIASLRAALNFAQQAIDSQKETISELKGQRDQARKDAKSAKRKAVVTTLLTIGVVAAKIFGVF